MKRIDWYQLLAWFQGLKFWAPREGLKKLRELLDFMRFWVQAELFWIWVLKSGMVLSEEDHQYSDTLRSWSRQHPEPLRAFVGSTQGQTLACTCCCYRALVRLLGVVPAAHMNKWGSSGQEDSLGARRWPWQADCCWEQLRPTLWVLPGMSRAVKPLCGMKIIPSKLCTHKGNVSLFCGQKLMISKSLFCG